jgi:hypothetical protein
VNCGLTSCLLVQAFSFVSSTFKTGSSVTQARLFPYWSTDVAQIEDLGPSVRIYFR